jgi:hypothetical protein
MGLDGTEKHLVHTQINTQIFVCAHLFSRQSGGTPPKTRPQAGRETPGFGWYFNPVCGEIAALSRDVRVSLEFPYFLIFPLYDFF